MAVPTPLFSINWTLIFLSFTFPFSSTTLTRFTIGVFPCFTDQSTISVIFALSAVFFASRSAVNIVAVPFKSSLSFFTLSPKSSTFLPLTFTFFAGTPGSNVTSTGFAWIPSSVTAFSRTLVFFLTFLTVIRPFSLISTLTSLILVPSIEAIENPISHLAVAGVIWI